MATPNPQHTSTSSAALTPPARALPTLAGEALGLLEHFGGAAAIQILLRVAMLTRIAEAKKEYDQQNRPFDTYFSTLIEEVGKQAAESFSKTILIELLEGTKRFQDHPKSTYALVQSLGIAGTFNAALKEKIDRPTCNRLEAEQPACPLSERVLGALLLEQHAQTA